MAGVNDIYNSYRPGGSGYVDYNAMRGFGSAEQNDPFLNSEGGVPEFDPSSINFGGGRTMQQPGMLDGSGFGLNVPTVGLALNGISQLGGLYFGLKQLGLAKDSFKLQKEAYRTNLANSTRSYNTQVGDRVAGRTYRTQAERDAALAAASLPTPGY